MPTAHRSPITRHSSPYRRAFDLWHSHGTPAMPWNDLLTWFFHHGSVVSLPDGFLLARPIRHDAPAERHLVLSPLQSTERADCWNVWLACGNLRRLLNCSALHPLPWVSFVRRGGMSVRIYRLAADEFAQDPAATASGPAARLRHGTGKNRRRS